MAAVNFPNSPSVNDTHTSSGSTWKWDGVVWQRLGVAGPQGAQGAQGHQGHQGRQGSVGIASLTIATAPPSSPDAGDMWWDSDDGDLHIYYNDGNSSQWASMNSGPAGPQGAQGVQGAAGAQGHQGRQGAQGNTGAQGAQGHQGVQGAANATTINNNADNRLITGSGTANTLNAEANLTYNGNTFSQAISNAGNGMNVTASGDHWTSYVGNSNRSSADTWVSKFAGQWNSNDIASFACMTGADTTNKDEGQLAFYTTPSGGSETERVRIDSSGRLIVGSGSHAGGAQVVIKGGGVNAYSVLGMYSNHTNPGNNILLSQIRFGSNATADGAEIRVYSDAAWGTNDYPTRMGFYTTPDSGSTRIERLRITKDGDVIVGGATLGAAGSFSMEDTGAVRSVLVTGNASDTLLGAISGVSNGFQINIDSSNNQSYRFHDGSQRMVTIESGRVLIGTTTEGYASADDLTVATTGNTGITIRSSTGGLGTLAFSDGTSGAAEYDGYIQYSQADQYMDFGGAGGNIRLRIDSGGRLLIGHTVSQSVYSTSALQIQGSSAAASSLSLLRQNGSPYLSLGATGGSSLGGVVAVSADDRLGQLTFVGADGTDVNTHACSIAGYVDGSVSGNTVPGRLVFKTSTGAGEVERMRITSAGRVGIGTNNPGTRDTSGSLDVYANLNNNGPYFRVLNTHSTYGGGFQQANNNAVGGVQFLNASGTSVASLYNSTGGWTWDSNLQIHGTAGLRIGPNLTSGYGNADLTVNTNTTTDGDFIAHFAGQSVGNAAGLGVAYYTCGGDDNRAGLYWEHQNVSNERMWMGDDKRLYLKNANPSLSTQNGRYLLTVAAGVLDHPDGSSADNAAKSALEIKMHYPDSQSGNYWIYDYNDTPRQIYCNMEVDGGGWMLWNDYNYGQTSMNEALGGSSTSPHTGLSRSNYNNYKHYTVWIEASHISSAGQALDSFVTLDHNGALKYCADYGREFFMEEEGDLFQPNKSMYFDNVSTGEFIKMDGAYQPQLGASNWQTFSGGGWQRVWIREKDRRMGHGDERSLYMIPRVYGFDSNGTPVWRKAENAFIRPYFHDCFYRNNLDVDGTIISSEHVSWTQGGKIGKENGTNNGPVLCGRLAGYLTGSFEIRFRLGYAWGWSTLKLCSTRAFEQRMLGNYGVDPYSGGGAQQGSFQLSNNSSNNIWMCSYWNHDNTYSESNYSPGGNNVYNVMWREDDGTIKVKMESGSAHSHTYGIKWAGPFLVHSGNQSPSSTKIDVIVDGTDSAAKWYK